ncbi:hypothetical protein [Anaerocolumna chitinilytica]|uniref:Uncharacterized protein n=1 Tax=Anaerocolumna chitinilytica TaxID=1727145 RepID=A0A7I8DPZ0_9FIRM|nr:hypothetical protein [Anaerocolumna chitinilytica]BCJ98346.1 hypothetical protein bsdcttw_13870 [Anaerocolumna chitinilytica]
MIIYVLFIFTICIIFTTYNYKKLSLRINVMKNMINVENLQIVLEEDMNYFVMISEMQKFEIELFMKLLKYYGDDKLKGLLINVEEYKNAEKYKPNFICEYNINMLPVIISNGKNGYYELIDPHN